MFKIKLIAIGNLKEGYWRDALAEYKKRLGAFAQVEIIELKEERVPESPSPAEIEAALEKEAGAILAAIPPRAFVTALCVEGKQLSSEAFAKKISDTSMQASEIVFIIGSSHGLSDKVKSAADMRLSVSEMTFPHQLMKVVLMESIYRAFNIISGTKYHK